MNNLVYLLKILLYHAINKEQLTFNVNKSRHSLVLFKNIQEWCENVRIIILYMGSTFTMVSTNHYQTTFSINIICYVEFATTNWISFNFFMCFYLLAWDSESQNNVKTHAKGNCPISITDKSQNLTKKGMVHQTSFQ